MVKLRARCLLVGDAAVGKSALSHMFHSEGTLFQKNYSMTTGVELLLKCVNIPETNDSVELYIIDSAGKETLVEGCEKMWGEPSLLCLVFDLTSEQSFANCGRWMERVRAHCRGLHLPGVLVGNKSDLSARREVESSVAQEWAQSQGLEYHETSARAMENCDAPLLSLARAFQSLYQERRETIQNLSPG
ncbi:putative intraflagellar transport protein 27 -like [Scophthalmus maximus]|uniref:Putative intraflagellar transport protein 27-like n=1 Tax=Scophthalmus maximus TaxID=52904 RepID=A0A2U9BML8_SCOMX|nr:intraflagellar transport protein 27 homolog [Scophthalmus maximus]XP_047189777.1 intraflagellar transport protein 27 homolog [Scophthalmus maximus]AWP05211.1 putative intraflagellar transport protein 27 -like [Scophthalmus maximus]